MSKAKNTNSNNVFNKRIIIRYDFTLCDIDVQLDNNEMGIIMVVNNKKYIDNPSRPK